MKIHRMLLVGLVSGLSAFAVSSCAYDPYYSASYGGYGDGFGYGNSSFSTSFFVNTGSSRWGYDPYAGCYYDFTRRAYYDPYLNGYYPVGYRPRYVFGSPHPHGWRRGASYCPPPSFVRSYNLTNYRNRTDRYRNLGKDWSRNVRDVSHRGQRSQFSDSRDGRQSPPYGFQGRSGDWQNNNGRGRRDDGRDINRFQGRDNGSFRNDGRGSAGDRGNTTVTIPQRRPEGTRTGGGFQGNAATERFFGGQPGFNGRSSRGDGVRPSFENREFNGRNSRQPGTPSGREGGGGGNRIRGIGEG